MPTATDEIGDLVREKPGEADPAVDLNSSTRPSNQRASSHEDLVKSRQRVVDHGEVFTPSWLVESMLDLVKDESERIDSRFLEPACGSGNFIVPILLRKLASANRRYGKSSFERAHHSLLALMCVYGIELLPDNVVECRENMMQAFVSTLNLDPSEDLSKAAKYVLAHNIVQGDALTMRTAAGTPIVFAEWGYLGRGKFQRRDFLFNVLTLMSSLTEEGSLFSHMGRHEIFTPLKSYPPLTVQDLAS